MAQLDTFTGKSPAETYTKIIQITDDNELLDGVGAAVSPTISGDLNVNGAIYIDGVEVGTSQDSYWTEDSNGNLNRTSNVDINGTLETNGITIDSNSSQIDKVGVGTSSPTAKLEIVMDHTTYGGDTPPFFLIKDHTGQEHLKVTQEGNVVLGHKTSAETAEAGGIYYNSTDNEFYLGYDE